MITVYAAYNFPFKPEEKEIVRDLRVMWALEELGMAYNFHWMDAMKGEHRKEPNLSINPFGRIPSLTDGDVKLFETGAIIHYLYDKAGKLPSDPVAHAKLLQWMFAALNTVEAPFLEVLRWNMFWREKAGRDVIYPEMVEAAKARVADLERVLGDKPYIMGEFSPADILMVTAIHFAMHEPSVFAQAPAVRAYMDRCKARPAYRAALAKQGVGPEGKAA